MALAGLVVFSACEDDRESNPVLNTSGNATFVLNAPEVGTSSVDLALSKGVAMTWNQPDLTDLHAPLGNVGSYGFSYAVQVSKDGNFTKSFDEAKAEATDAEGNIGTISGQDYTVVEAYNNSTKSWQHQQFYGASNLIPAEGLNRSLNELYIWDESEFSKTPVEVFVRVIAQYTNGFGVAKQLATSNVQKLSLIPSEWVDVAAVPVEVGYLWVPGNGNGWNHGVCPILVAEDGVTFKGYAYMDGEFKFTVADNWNDGELNNGSFTSTTENVDLGDGGGGNLNYTGEASMCWIECTPSTGELLITPVKWGVVGGFNGWSVNDGEIVDMTYNKSDHCLEAIIDGGLTGEWKLARDNSWDVNFGGSFDAPEQDGPNFTAEGSRVCLYLERPKPNGEGIHITIE